MSNFICEHCGANIVDSEQGYVTGCEHYPMEMGPPGKLEWSVSFNMLVNTFEEWLLWQDYTVWRDAVLDDMDRELKYYHALHHNMVIFTCHSCYEAMGCPYAYDSYNLEHICLAYE